MSWLRSPRVRCALAIVLVALLGCGLLFFAGGCGLPAPVFVFAAAFLIAAADAWLYAEGYIGEPFAASAPARAPPIDPSC